jgi:hypothetical protein
VINNNLRLALCYFFFGIFDFGSGFLLVEQGRVKSGKWLSIHTVKSTVIK